MYILISKAAGMESSLDDSFEIALYYSKIQLNLQRWKFLFTCEIQHLKDIDILKIVIQSGRREQK